MLPQPLVGGHVHQAWDRLLGRCAILLPTSRPGYWLVEVLGTRAQRTPGPVPEDTIAATLETFGFRDGAEWVHWPGAPRDEFAD